MSAPSPHSPAPGGNDYQDRDIRMRPIVIFGVVTVVFLALSFIGLRFLFRSLEAARKTTAPPLQAERLLPPAPRLQVLESADLAKHVAWEEARIHTYGWVNQAAGVAHLPVDAARAKALAKGFPVRGAAAPAAPAPTGGGR